MSIEENAEIANQFAQVWGQFSLTAIDELASPDLVVIYPVFEQSPLALVAFTRLHGSARQRVLGRSR